MTISQAINQATYKWQACLTQFGLLITYILGQNTERRSSSSRNGTINMPDLCCIFCYVIINIFKFSSSVFAWTGLQQKTKSRTFCHPYQKVIQSGSPLVERLKHSGKCLRYFTLFQSVSQHVRNMRCPELCALAVKVLDTLASHAARTFSDYSSGRFAPKKFHNCFLYHRQKTSEHYIFQCENQFHPRVSTRSTLRLVLLELFSQLSMLER